MEHESGMNDWTSSGLELGWKENITWTMLVHHNLFPVLMDCICATDMCLCILAFACYFIQEDSVINVCSCVSHCDCV